MGYIYKLDVVPTLEEMIDKGEFSNKYLYDFICEYWSSIEDGNDLETLAYYLFECRYSLSCRYEITKQLKKQLKKQINAHGYITVYRGFNKYSREDGNSFTLSKDKAIWFSKRFGDEGYVNKYEIHIDNVIAFITDRNEAEIIADPDDVILLATTKLLEI